MSSSTSGRTLAHELGHLIGLRDIYDMQRIRDTMRTMPGSSMPVVKACFEDHRCDWGEESGRGFYSSDDTHGKIIRSLLMYGNETIGDITAVDLPDGDVIGYAKNPMDVFSTTNNNVGVSGIVLP